MDDKRKGALQSWEGMMNTWFAKILCLIRLYKGDAFAPLLQPWYCASSNYDATKQYQFLGLLLFSNLVFLDQMI